MSSVSNAIERILDLYINLSRCYSIGCPKLFTYDDISTPGNQEEDQSIPENATYLEFTDVDRVLNENKNALDDIEPSYFEIVDMYSFLKEFYENRKNAQLVTSTWLNFSEICNRYNIIHKNDEINVFFSVELPDSSISATNHYCNTHNIKLNWLAASSAPLNIDGNPLVVNDNNGIYDKYPDNWIGMKKYEMKKYKMNIDFTNIDNLIAIEKHVLDEYKNGVDLYISNVGVNNFSDINNLEVIYSNIYFGHILTGLLILKRGGNLCAKQYTFFKPLTLSIIMLLSNVFKTVEFVTTATANCFTSEVYLVCKGFIGLTETLKTELFNIFKSYIEIGDTATSSLLPFYKCNSNTVSTLNEIKDKSKLIFENAYSRIIGYVNTILSSIDPSNLLLSKGILKDLLLQNRIELEDNYIRTNNIRKLEQKFMLTTKKDLAMNNIETSFSQHIIQTARFYSSPLSYREIIIVEESKYSSLRPDHMNSVKKFYNTNLLFSESTPLNIIDGTAHVGVDSIYLATIFNRENVSILSVEINPDTFKVLEKNLANISNIIYDRSGYLGKIQALNIDIVKYIIDTPDLQYTDILYLDPPWGGHGYLDNPYIELTLGKMSFAELVALSIIKKIKNIVCKIPKNLNFAKFIDDVYKYLIIQDSIKQLEPIPTQSELYFSNKFDVMTGSDVSYSIILFKNLIQ
jgi:hypothetical protein